MTALRTAATSVVAARPILPVVGGTPAVINAGRVARAHAELLPKALPFDRVVVVSARGDPRRAEALVNELSRNQTIEFRAASDIPEALALADVVVTATVAHRPLFTADELRSARLLIVAGLFLPGKTEVPITLLRAAHSIVSDLPDRLRSQWTEPNPEGVTPNDLARVVSLADALPTGPKLRSDLSLFLSDGLGLEDLVAARLVYKAALRRRRTGAHALMQRHVPTTSTGRRDASRKERHQTDADA